MGVFIVYSPVLIINPISSTTNSSWLTQFDQSSTVEQLFDILMNMLGYPSFLWTFGVLLVIVVLSYLKRDKKLLYVLLILFTILIIYPYQIPVRVFSLVTPILFLLIVDIIYLMDKNVLVLFMTIHVVLNFVRNTQYEMSYEHHYLMVRNTINGDPQAPIKDKDLLQVMRQYYSSE